MSERFHPPSRQAGFTLVEVLVTLGVTVILLLGVLALFDFNNRIARVQTHVADMQQSLRVAQYDMVRLVRMTGRGGLPSADALGPPPPRQLPTGIAVELADNVPANTFVLAGQEGTRVVTGTDILTVRGAFTTPIYQINTVAIGAFVLDNNLNPTSGSVEIEERGPTGVAQNLEPLADAINDQRPEALVLVSPLGDEIYAVVELNPGGSVVTTEVRDGKSVPTHVSTAFRISGGTHTTDYLKLSRAGAFPPQLRSIGYVGLLEEYRFYIREQHVIPGDLASDLAPRLARARFYPGTTAVHAGLVTNAEVDVADNILDLQVALGVDRNGDRQIVENGGAEDEWLGNHPEDLAVPGRWQGNPPPGVYYVRVSTVAQTDRRDPQYQAPPLVSLENRSYPASYNNRETRMFRRRTLQTVIDLRNLA